MSRPNGFEWRRRKNGDVIITHYGRHATVLRGSAAINFLAEIESGGIESGDIESGDNQELMARITGNYKRGNERDARNHPRNQ